MAHKVLRVVPKKQAVVMVLNSEPTKIINVGQILADLENDREKVLREISELRKGITISQEVVDPEELCSIESGTSDNIFLIEQRRSTLHLIDEAKLRVQEGTYGECLDCGGEIPPSRLKAVLWALRCMPCQEGREHLSHRH